MALEVAPYRDALAEDWDSFLSTCLNGTFLQSRRFLAYHANRLNDTSLVITKRGRIVGLLPAAEDPTNPQIVVSHPGSTFGGVVHRGELLGEKMIRAFEAIAKYFSETGYTDFVYRCIPPAYSLSIMQDDIYALKTLGAVDSRLLLSSVIDLERQRKLTKRRVRSLAKARNYFDVVSGIHQLPSYWAILEDALCARYGAQPIHSLAEITQLATLFPQEIQLTCAVRHDEVIAGIVTFRLGDSSHCQYMASTSDGMKNSSLDLIINQLIVDARALDLRYFDFGTSNGSPDKSLNSGLYSFKSEFGGQGMIHEVLAMRI